MIGLTLDWLPLFVPPGIFLFSLNGIFIQLTSRTSHHFQKDTHSDVTIKKLKHYSTWVREKTLNVILWLACIHVNTLLAGNACNCKSELTLCLYVCVSLFDVLERSERQAALHHVLLLLWPGGLWADPLLLQWKTPSLLQCCHRPSESYICCSVAQNPWSMCECLCVSYVLYVLCSCWLCIFSVLSSWKSECVLSDCSTMVKACHLLYTHRQRTQLLLAAHTSVSSLPLFNLFGLFFCTFSIFFQNPCPETTAGFLSTMTFWWFTRWVYTALCHCTQHPWTHFVACMLICMELQSAC